MFTRNHPTTIIGELAQNTMGFKGWMFDREKPNKHLQAVLSVNGVPVEKSRARHYRNTLVRDGIHPTGKCGFQFRFDTKDLKVGDVVDIYEKKSNFRIEGVPFAKSEHKIYFMHIPKTAGSALNSFLTDKVGRPCSRVHIDKPELLNQTVDRIPELNFISGHLPIHAFASHADLSPFLKITLLRDPFKHLVSHLAWCRRLSEEPMRQKFSHQPLQRQNLIRTLKNYDFSNLNQVEELVKTLSDTGIRTFDNFQTRYFLPRSNQAIQNRIRMEDLNATAKVLNMFDIIGVNEHFDDFLQKLCGYLNCDYIPADMKMVNVHRERFGLDPENEDLRRILLPLYRIDEELYQSVKSRF